MASYNPFRAMARRQEDTLPHVQGYRFPPARDPPLPHRPEADDPSPPFAFDTLISPVRSPPIQQSNIPPRTTAEYVPPPGSIAVLLFPLPSSTRSAPGALPSSTTEGSRHGQRHRVRDQSLPSASVGVSTVTFDQLSEYLIRAVLERLPSYHTQPGEGERVGDVNLENGRPVSRVIDERRGRDGQVDRGERQRRMERHMREELSREARLVNQAGPSRLPISRRSPRSSLLTSTLSTQSLYRGDPNEQAPNQRREREREPLLRERVSEWRLLPPHDNGGPHHPHQHNSDLISARGQRDSDSNSSHPPLPPPPPGGGTNYQRLCRRLVDEFQAHLDANPQLEAELRTTGADGQRRSIAALQNAAQQVVTRLLSPVHLPSTSLHEIRRDDGGRSGLAQRDRLHHRSHAQAIDKGKGRQREHSTRKAIGAEVTARNQADEQLARLSEEALTPIVPMRLRTAPRQTGEQGPSAPRIEVAPPTTLRPGRVDVRAAKVETVYSDSNRSRIDPLPRVEPKDSHRAPAGKGDRSEVHEYQCTTRHPEPPHARTQKDKEGFSSGEHIHLVTPYGSPNQTHKYYRPWDLSKGDKDKFVSRGVCKGNDKEALEIEEIPRHRDQSAFHNQQNRFAGHPPPPIIRKDDRQPAQSSQSHNVGEGRTDGLPTHNQQMTVPLVNVGYEGTKVSVEEKQAWTWNMNNSSGVKYTRSQTARHIDKNGRDIQHKTSISVDGVGLPPMPIFPNVQPASGGTSTISMSVSTSFPTATSATVTTSSQQNPPRSSSTPQTAGPATIGSNANQPAIIGMPPATMIPFPVPVAVPTTLSMPMPMMPPGTPWAGRPNSWYL